MKCLPTNRRVHSPHRSGFTLLEMFVSVVVFGAVLMTFLPLVHAVRQQQRATDQHLLALREADNVLEGVSQRSWSELTTEELSKLTLPEAVKAHLPQAELKADVTETADQPTKRIAVRVSWTPHAGQPARAVQLVAWLTNPEVQP